MTTKEKPLHWLLEPLRTLQMAGELFFISKAKSVCFELES
jgi:hypothetical protein